MLRLTKYDRKFARIIIEFTDYFMDPLEVKYSKSTIKEIFQNTQSSQNFELFYIHKNKNTKKIRLP